MVRLITGALIIGIGLISCSITVKSVNRTDSIDPSLSIMTYNIRLDVASDGENAWPNRADFLISQVQFMNPDIMGVQEARPNQMIDLKNSLRNYKSIGTGRDGLDKGEYSAIFYNSNKLKVDKEGTFWLSNTPAQISKGWDAAYPRICTYGLFTALQSNKQFWVFNTHLDHVGKEAQKQGIHLILDRITAVNRDNLPVILMGDFNVEPDSELIQDLTAKMNDTQAIAKVRFGSEGTFNGFDVDTPATRRIDYIMVSKTSVSVNRYGVLSSIKGQKYPSDHFPVMVYLSF